MEYPHLMHKERTMQSKTETERLEPEEENILLELSENWNPEGRCHSRCQMWGKKTGRKQRKKPPNPDCSLLLPTNLPLDEPNLKSTSNGSHVMGCAGANS